MYVRLDTIQPRTEEFVKRSWKAGGWSSNSVINNDGIIIDARLKGGLRPSPVTRDLTWGVPVPDIEGEDNEEMKGKVLCTPLFIISTEAHTLICPVSYQTSGYVSQIQAPIFHIKE